MDAKEILALQPQGSKAENWIIKKESNQHEVCLLYTSDAADE